MDFSSEGGFDGQYDFGSDDNSGYDASYEYQGYSDQPMNMVPATPSNPNNAYSPYPNTSVEDVKLPHYIPEQTINSKDVPYYDEKNIIKSNSNRQMTPVQKEAPVRSRNTPAPDQEEETPSIQQKDLDKIRSAHQRVLDRYKQRTTNEDAVSFEDTEYFDQIIKKVISKEKKN